MKHAIKQIYGPRDNRHYTSRRTSAIYFTATLTVLILLMLYMLLTGEWLLAFALFVAIASQATLYMAFDGMSDKLWWNLVYKRFYGTKDPSAEDQAMKQFEEQPTGSNLQHLQKTIRRK